VEDAIGPGLLETFDRGVHSLLGSSEGAASQHLDLLHVSDFGARIDDFLLGFEELLSEVPELQHFSFDKGVPELLYSVIDNELIRLSVLEDTLSKGVKRELRTIARSCS
jgi:hypothetical protein